MTDLAALFEEQWNAECEKREAESPSFTRDQFVATGRAGAEFGGKRTEKWWLKEGPVMVQRWLDWRDKNGWTIWDVNGEPAIELSFLITLPGDIVVKGFIDRLFVTPVGELVVVDLKSGRSPETPEQLGLYATAIEMLYGVRPTWGYFWDAQKGEHSQPHLLDLYTADYLAGVYEEAIAGINAGAWLAKPANNCRAWCGVARFCAAVGGSEAADHDPLLRVSK